VTLLGRLGVLLLAGASACSGGSGDSAPAADERDNGGALVVYADHDAESGLAELLDAFTAETGIDVSIVTGTAERHADALIDRSDDPKADVIFSTRLQPIWRAAEEGALRPILSDVVEARVPETLRDPDGLWTAVSVVHARLLVDTRAIDQALVTGYDYLADPSLDGRVCLTRSSLPLNRAVIARLIDRLGRRPAELVVRGWISNLAEPPFDTEAELVAAIAAGNCGVGIVSSATGRPIVPGFVRQPLSAVTPVPPVSNVETIGISRHAGNPDAARRLVEWLVSEVVQETYPASRGLEPAAGGEPLLDPTPVRVIGWQDAEAVLLAERARYR
jgi:iron(III) transport system substrate-binding protein